MSFMYFQKEQDVIDEKNRIQKDFKSSKFKAGIGSLLMMGGVYLMAEHFKHSVFNMNSSVISACANLWHAPETFVSYTALGVGFVVGVNGIAPLVEGAFGIKARKEALAQCDEKLKYMRGEGADIPKAREIIAGNEMLNSALSDASDEQIKGICGSSYKVLKGLAR
jgi:pterin-4a-carbinolamine dehydratase